MFAYGLNLHQEERSGTGAQEERRGTEAEPVGTEVMCN